MPYPGIMYVIFNSTMYIGQALDLNHGELDELLRAKLENVYKVNIDRTSLPLKQRLTKMYTECFRCPINTVIWGVPDIELETAYLERVDED